MIIFVIYILQIQNGGNLMLKKYRIQILLVYYVIFMVLLASLPITANIMSFLANGDIYKASEYLTIFLYVTHIVLFVIVYLTFREDLKVKIKEFSTNFKKNLKYIVLGLISIFISNMIIGLFIQQSGTNQETLSTMQQGSVGLMIVCFYLITVIIGPINEEIIFRRILIGDGKKYLSVIGSLIFSSITFSLIHIHSIKEITLIIPYMCTGVILGFVYIKNNNIITSISLHILNNLVGVILLLFI